MKTELKPEEITLVRLAKEYCDSEEKARDLLESWRWPNGPICPHCKNDGTAKPNSRIQAKSKTGVREGVYFCGACRKQFTVTVGTIFEGSHLPISMWLMAVFIMCSSKKSVSSLQLQRMLGIKSYKSAWFMTHRIRHALAPDMPLGKLLNGTVEVDETFVGGKGDMETRSKRKVPVVALIERGGNAYTRVIPSVTQKNLAQCLNECVDKSAIINTDDSGASRGTVKPYKAHHVVNHSKKEYALKLPSGAPAHVNTCESFFSLLKRGVYGSWHHVSREHLPKYANEFAFRWNHRKATDGERTLAAIRATEGKRLTYRPLISLRKQDKPETPFQISKRIFKEPPQ